MRAYSLINKQIGSTGVIRYFDNSIFMRFNLPREYRDEFIFNMLEFFESEGFQSRGLHECQNLGKDVTGRVSSRDSSKAKSKTGKSAYEMFYLRRQGKLLPNPGKKKVKKNAK